MEKISMFETALLNNNLAPNTITSYITTLKLYSSWLSSKGWDINDTDLKFSPAILVEYLKDVIKNENCTINTLNSKITAFRKYRSMVLGQEEEFDLPYLPEIEGAYKNSLSTSELAETLAKISRYKDKAIVFLHLYAGLSVSEVCELYVRDIVDGNLYVSNKRIVPLHPKLDAALKQHMKHKKIDPVNDADKKLFCTTRGDISPSGIFRIARKYSAENREYTPTLFRHTFYNELLNRGTPLDIIYYLMGKKVVYFDIPDYFEVKNYISLI